MTTTTIPEAAGAGPREMPWTPGPWSHYSSYTGEPNTFEVGPDEFDTVAHVRLGSDDVQGNCEANARLIAAAPDLFAALLDITNRAENFAHSHAMIANGRGHVEGTQLRYSVDRARRALALATVPDTAGAGRADDGEGR